MTIIYYNKVNVEHETSEDNKNRKLFAKKKIK